jgi:hypothetical protein
MTEQSKSESADVSGRAFGVGGIDIELNLVPR